MSNEQDQMIDGLLARYLGGEADAAETEQAEAWINASPENRAYFAGMQLVWENAKRASDEHEFDTDAAWHRMKTRMYMTEERRPLYRRTGFRVAAGVALLIIAGISIFRLAQEKDLVKPRMVEEYWSAQGNPERTLPDGSTITLNRNSRLQYPSAFGDTREVTLEGEVFFNVARNPACPFIVHAGAVEVKVLGTSFNVSAYPGSDSVRVSVVSGKVECTVGNQTVTLTGGEVAVYNNRTQVLRKGTEGDPNTFAWRTRTFEFSNTPLSVAVRRLNDAYGSGIVIKNPAIGDCRFNATFRNDSIENIVEVIGDVLELTVEKKGQTFLLDGKGCK